MKPGIRVFFILIALVGGFFGNNFFMEHCVNRECPEPWFTLGLIAIILVSMIALRIIYVQIRKLFKL